MLSLVLRRILISIPLLIVATFIVFWMVRTTSAFDPTARLANSRDPEVIQRERERLGLDDPIPVQYGRWLGDALTGDLGESQNKNEEVSTMLSRAFWNTLQLIFWGVLLAATIAMSVGVYSAVKQYSLGDYVFTGLSYLGIAMPPFFFGLLAIAYLAAWPQRVFDLDRPPLEFVNLHQPGMSGFNWDYVKHLVLPVLTLTVQIIASWTRFQRASTLDVLSSDYVRTAKAKGVPRRKVILKHAVRNSLIPLVTVMAVDIGLLFGGLLVTEQIFSIPGMGRLFITALQNGDAPVILGYILVAGTFVIVFNLLADLLYGVLDPRVRLS
jgi:peptide/nickel transport system permease protein